MILCIFALSFVWKPLLLFLLNSAISYHIIGLVVAAAMLLLSDDDNNNDMNRTGGTLLGVVQDLKRKRGTVLTNLFFQKQLCILAANSDRLGELPPDKTYSNGPGPLRKPKHHNGQFESMFW